MRDTALSIAAGIGIVAIAQIVLETTGYFSVGTVRHWEESIARTRHELSLALSSGVVMPMIALLLALAVTWPQLGLVQRFATLKKWGGRVLIALTTITSFTFFSYTVASVAESRWVAVRRPAAQAAVERIRNRSQEIVSLVWVSESVRALPPPKRSALLGFLETTARKSDTGGVISEGAEWIVRTAPTISTQKTGQRTDVFDRVSEWLQSRLSAPSLQDVTDVLATAQVLEQAASEARSAAEEAVKAAIGQLVPSKLDPLVQSFVKALGAALVKTSFQKLDTHDVTNVAAAEKFVTKKIPSLDGSLPPQTMVELWPWEFRTRGQQPANSGNSGATFNEGAQLSDILSGDFKEPRRLGGFDGLSQRFRGIPDFHPGPAAPFHPSPPVYTVIR